MKAIDAAIQMHELAKVVDAAIENGNLSGRDPDGVRRLMAQATALKTLGQAGVDQLFALAGEMRLEIAAVAVGNAMPAPCQVACCIVAILQGLQALDRIHDSFDVFLERGQRGDGRL